VSGELSGPKIVIATLLLFCRIGACMMIVPGVGNSQIPTQVRVFVAVASTLALSPLLIDKAHVDSLDPIPLTRLIVGELLIGGVIGVLARMFFSALETLAFVTASLLSLANPFGVEVEQSQSLPPLATIVTLGATTMIFVANFHWQIVIALVDSYHAIPFGSAFDARRSLVEIGDVLGQSFLVGVRVAAPFFLYSVIVNFAMALINRVTPQIAIFFIAPPFIVAGGVLLLYFTIRGQIAEFMAAFSSWLGSG
jgi:flagellar biosynthetic protein FliR